jgi:exopolyphosphatase / guanosine-5'-triphosphate,3'-diphosphate pyrophosphatase
MKLIAILDLGTNTFNLLIAEVKPDNSYTILLSEKRPVKLGEERINKGDIGIPAFSRGIEAIEYYFEIIKSYQAKQIKAFGTSAIRTASNGSDFLNTIREKTGIEVEIVSGNREAELIYLGVRQTLLLNNQKFLILDIGGGSNEFILADMDTIYWKKSYPLGIARLLERFNPSDPLTGNEANNITSYVEAELQDLFEVIRNNTVNTIIGASGSFETFVHMIKESEVVETESDTEAVCNEIPLASFEKLHQKLLYSTTSERHKMKGLEPMRIEMIVLASLFVKILFDNHTFETLYQSNFSLKEGAIFEMLNAKV